METTVSILDLDVIQRLRELDEDSSGSFLREVVELYFQTGDRLILDIHKSIGSGNAESVGKSAHTLKGASLNVGAPAMADLCKDLEKSSKRNDFSNIEQKLSKLDEVYLSTRTALQIEAGLQ